jgi:hypothetical protein
MDVTSIANLATDLALTKTAQSAGVTILKKAIDLESASALALIRYISAPPALPAHLGQLVSTIA